MNAILFHIEQFLLYDRAYSKLGKFECQQGYFVYDGLILPGNLPCQSRVEDEER